MSNVRGELPGTTGEGDKQLEPASSPEPTSPSPPTSSNDESSAADKPTDSAESTEKDEIPYVPMDVDESKVADAHKLTYAPGMKLNFLNKHCVDKVPFREALCISFVKTPILDTVMLKIKASHSWEYRQVRIRGNVLALFGSPYEATPLLYVDLSQPNFECDTMAGDKMTKIPNVDAGKKKYILFGEEAPEELELTKFSFWGDGYWLNIRLPERVIPLIFKTKEERDSWMYLMNEARNAPVAPKESLGVRVAQVMRFEHVLLGCISGKEGDPFSLKERRINMLIFIALLFGISTTYSLADQTAGRRCDYWKDMKNNCEAQHKALEIDTPVADYCKEGVTSATRFGYTSNDFGSGSFGNSGSYNFTTEGIYRYPSPLNHPNYSDELEEVKANYELAYNGKDRVHVFCAPSMSYGAGDTRSYSWLMPSYHTTRDSTRSYIQVVNESTKKATYGDGRYGDLTLFAPFDEYTDQGPISTYSGTKVLAANPDMQPPMEIEDLWCAHPTKTEGACAQRSSFTSAIMVFLITTVLHTVSQSLMRWNGPFHADSFEKKRNEKSKIWIFLVAIITIGTCCTAFTDIPPSSRLAALGDFFIGFTLKQFQKLPMVVFKCIKKDKALAKESAKASEGSKV